MSRWPKIFVALSSIAALGLDTALAVAQDTGGNNDSGGSTPTQVSVPEGSGNGTTIVVQPSTTTTTTSTSPYGFPQPGTDINAGLPSSSRPTTNTNEPSDTFDLNQSSGGPAVVYGGKNASGVFLGSRPLGVPSIHVVRRGDTLWDLCARYYNNPWDWPKVWSYNPQIQNPHWIYPGDQIRMRPNGAQAGTEPTAGGIEGSTYLSEKPGASAGTGTVFLRDQGYIDDPERNEWGTLIGAREDQMLLSQGNRIYLAMRPGHDPQLGQLLTIYRPVRQPKNVHGARRPPGEVIAIKGTVKIDQWDPKTRIARGQIVESLDVIERGALVGPVGRRFDVVPPRTNEKTVWARIVTSVYPHIYLGQNQVVFIDKGSEDGLEPGNRLFVVRRGDSWRDSLRQAALSARQRLRMDDPGKAPVESTPLEGNEKQFPEEVIGEIRVLNTHRYSSACLVTVSHSEIVVGDRAVAKAGY
jgi:LysM domain